MYFSILIPVYNVEKYIRQSIESVLNQEEQDFEIILVDDGSTDNSGTICDEYSTKYPNKIKVIHKRNEGLLLTRRRAICEAKGKWLVHLDSDDYMLSGALQAIKEKCENKDVDMVIAKIIYGQKDENDMSVISQLPFHEGELFITDEERYRLKMQLLYGGQMTAIYQKVVKREIVDVDMNYQKFRDVSMMEDHLQSLALLENSKKAVFMDKPIIYYRYNDESITKKRGLASYSTSFDSIATVYLEEDIYRAKWGIHRADDTAICAKHLRKLCPFLINIVKIAQSHELQEFLMRLKNQKGLRKNFENADKKILGYKSRIIFKLAFAGCGILLKLICK